MNIKNISGENKTASIGISFDIPSEREIIAIGSPDRLKAYFTLGIENPEIEIRTRKLGSLVDEMNELALMIKCKHLPNDPTAYAAL